MHFILLIAFHQNEWIINSFNRNYILVYYVCQVIFNCYTIPSSDKIVKKEILLSVKRPFNFAFLLSKFLGIFMDLFIYLMTVSLDQLRGVIGTFNCGTLFTINSHNINLTGSFIDFLLIFILTKWLCISLLTLLYIFSFLLCNGDIEPNPGPKKLKQNSQSICHWNLNSLSAHNFAKLTQLKAYNSIYKHDFICLSETYLDSATPKNLLEIEGYNLVRADHLHNVKTGGVCIHYKESLPVQTVNLIF